MESLQALLSYISKRITLKEELTQLQSDPVWKRLKASDPSAETWELGKLLAYGENSTTKKTVQQSSKESIEGLPGKTGVVSGERVSPESPPVEVKEKGDNNPPPAAPTGLGIVVGIEPISTIIKTLEELSEDRALLLRAQTYSFRYRTSIYRWSLLLNRLYDEATKRLYEEATSDDSSKGQETKTPGMRISKLTLPQVEELVNVNLPDISEEERLLKEASFTFPSIGVPLGIVSATLFVEIGLLLLTAYFWIWYREARISPTFPAIPQVRPFERIDPRFPNSVRVPSLPPVQNLPVIIRVYDEFGLGASVEFTVSLISSPPGQVARRRDLHTRRASI